jgi:hypothetical protein
MPIWKKSGTHPYQHHAQIAGQELGDGQTIQQDDQDDPASKGQPHQISSWGVTHFR